MNYVMLMSEDCSIDTYRSEDQYVTRISLTLCLSQFKALSNKHRQYSLQRTYEF